MTDHTPGHPSEPLRAIVEFLDGAQPLEEVWFGEPHPTKKGAFWWRQNLRDAVAALATSVQAEPDYWPTCPTCGAGGYCVHRDLLACAAPQGTQTELEDNHAADAAAAMGYAQGTQAEPALQSRVQIKSTGEYGTVTHIDPAKAARYHVHFTRGFGNVFGIEEFVAPQGTSGHPVGTGRDAYEGCREDLLDWKRRAQVAEAKLVESAETVAQLTRALGEEVNGQTFMGEPVLPSGHPVAEPCYSQSALRGSGHPVGEREELTDAQIDEAAHDLQRVIGKCGGDSTECAYDYLRNIIAKLPAKFSDKAARMSDGAYGWNAAIDACSDALKGQP